MLETTNVRRWIVLVGGVVVGGVFVGAVIASQFRGSEAPQDLQAAIRSEPLVKVAEFPAWNGSAGRGVFVQATSAGFLCLWDAPSATSPARLGGCNRTDDPFAGREMLVSFAYDGGPAPADVRDARLIGLVSQAAAEVQVLMDDGTRRSMRLRVARIGGDTYRVFAHRVDRSDLRARVAPTAVVALDAEGREIDRQSTGFAG